MKLYILLLALLVLSACKKDANKACGCSNSSSACTDLPLPPPPGKDDIYSQPNYFFDPSYVDYPYFNPNNDNEILYYARYAIPLQQQQLIKYNLATHQKQLLFTGQLLSRPKWGRNGWILLNVNSQIYKIREDGSNLTQLTFDSLGSNYNPEWNYTGDKFVVKHQYKKPGVKADTLMSFLLVYDEDGQPLDTLNAFAYPKCWQNQKGLLLVSEGSSPFSVWDIFNHSETVLHSLKGEDQNPFWSPDGNELYYTSKCGLSKINYASGKKNCLKTRCANESYNSICISSSSQKILCMKEHLKAPNWYNQYYSSKLVLMNLDGSNEKEINMY
ncbi:MAG: hypothetical protein KIS94_13935 [Chitinophagales bacterium]|nr:hypothetical protein [Chitinophagales bacterium]